MDIIFSNRLESLYLFLKKRLLAENRPPFCRANIIVPSIAVKQWLTNRIADDPDFSIAMGLSISYLEQSLQRLLRQERAALPSKLELAFAIEQAMTQGITSKKGADWLQLKNYLSTSRPRLISLANRLADLFHQYGLYGRDLVKGWDNQGGSGWQADIWRSLFSGPAPKWSYPAKLYDAPFAPPASYTAPIHLFSMSYLTPIHHKFLKSVSETIPVSYYILSPCKAFWSDILSDRESDRLLTYWRKKEVGEEEILALDEYLHDRNPLLANYGVLGREMAKLFDSDAADRQDAYLFPGAVADDAAYSDCLIEEWELEPKKGPLTLLEAVQSDMGLLRAPTETAPTIDPNDHSIAIHMAHSYFREVEIVRDIIGHWMQDSGWLPEDIFVLAPNIGRYVPFIQAVFQEEIDLPDIHLMDLGGINQGPAIQGLIKLIQLADSRLTTPDLIDLFSNRAFMKKQRLTTDDIDKIREWMQKCPWTWGESGSARTEVLTKEYGFPPDSPLSHVGSYRHALDTLLSDLIYSKQSVLIRMSDTTLLESLMQMMQKLRLALLPLQDQQPDNPYKWLDWIRRTADAFFVMEEEEATTLKDVLDEFYALFDTIGDHPIYFDSIKARFITALSADSDNLRQKNISSVTFSSMLPMRAIPAKGIIIMGMEEGSFPKRDLSCDLDERQKRPDLVDFSPSITDYDRFLFLEALLSAREKIAFTHQGISPDDGQPLPPNSLVNELITYCKEAYNIPIHTPAHSPYGFDKRYYQEGSTFKSISRRGFQEALGHYKPQKEKPQFFIADSSTKPDEMAKKLTLQQLEECIKKPFKTYFNHALNFRIPDEQEELSEGDTTEINALDKWLIRKEALKEPVEDTLARFQSLGKIPDGSLGRQLMQQLTKEINSRKKSIPGPVFDVTFSERCKTPDRDALGNHLLPAITLPSGIIIEGTIASCTRDGIIDFKTKEDGKKLRYLPKLLALDYAQKQYSSSVNPHVLFKDKSISSFSKNATADLSQLVDYYRLCQKSPSPLCEDWIIHITNGDYLAIDDALKNHTIYDPYMKWLFHNRYLDDIDSIARPWAQTNQELFKPAIDEWMT